MKNKIIKIAVMLFIIVISAILWANSTYASTIANGTAGKEITWTLDTNGVLTLSGKGDMENNSESPWATYQDKVKSVVFNGDITSIGNYAFKGNKNIQKIELPKTVTDICEMAFFECSNLKTVIFPDGISQIGKGAFWKCTSLNSVELKNDRVLYIWKYAFADCTSLKTIKFISENTKIDEEPETISPTATIYGRDLSAEYYYARYHGRNFVDIETNKASKATITNTDYLNILPTKNVKASGIASLRNSSVSNGIYQGYTTDFCNTKDESNLTYKEIKNTVISLTANCTTQAEKAQAIANWILTNIQYQWGFGAGAVINTPYTIFKEKKGNCSGMTMLTNYMLYLCNIPTAVITNHGHEWSVAFVDGKWVYIDSGVYNSASQRAMQLTFVYEDMVYVVEDPTRGITLTGIAKSEEELNKITSFTIPNKSYIKNIYPATFKNSWELKATIGTLGEKIVKENRRCVYRSGNQIIGREFHDEDKVVEENRIEPTYEKEGSYQQVVYCSKCNTEMRRYNKTITRLYKNPSTSGTTTTNYKLGDVNNDGKINTRDAREVLLTYIGKKTLTQDQKQAADVNKDGKVNTKDARQILLYYIGKIKQF